MEEEEAAAAAAAEAERVAVEQAAAAAAATTEAKGNALAEEATALAQFELQPECDISAVQIQIIIRVVDVSA